MISQGQILIALFVTFLIMILAFRLGRALYSS
jgi:photosystem I reaction center subunit XII|uniref:Photosystem I reaction center subunit XII n=3 Tax=Juniperus TaxID=13100 RepID=X2D461_JUNSC|nr:photosystem I protein M [Juniperus bermudiana]YP_009026724.1 photosystem I protein M [Juniperus scopulorum]YP_009026822.1 photosystem I protein M [Juniperus virginiana]AHH30061.1 photosystem I protein M [Juniperus bermudiana]AHH30251.1 photosystem I protein M [Juniperus scopulorum]AHH30334.1 photosystem I protein M [Juniperus virginiana]UZH44265.1 photosystem I protein M [Juniperus virginiana]